LRQRKTSQTNWLEGSIQQLRPRHIDCIARDFQIPLHSLSAFADEKGLTERLTEGGRPMDYPQDLVRVPSKETTPPWPSTASDRGA
jgi:hypothetical protein